MTEKKVCLEFHFLFKSRLNDILRTDERINRDFTSTVFYSCTKSFQTTQADGTAHSRIEAQEHREDVLTRSKSTLGH